MGNQYELLYATRLLTGLFFTSNAEFLCHFYVFAFFLLADRLSPDKPRDVKIDIEDGSVEDRRRRRVHSPSSPDKRRSATSRSTTEATIITDQEDAQSVIPLNTVFGVVTLPRVKLLASVGGLILETEIREINVAFSRKQETEKNGEGLSFSLLLCKIPLCKTLTMNFFVFIVFRTSEVVCDRTSRENKSGFERNVEVCHRVRKETCNLI